MSLRDASIQAHSGIGPKHGAEWAPSRSWLSPVPLEQAMTTKTGPAGVAVLAYANHGRWVVDCPDCGGAQLACRTDRRFMCNECANAVVDGLWRPVIWPDDLEAVEAALQLRPTKNQNWLPEETVDDLLQQNDLMLGGE